MGDGCDQSAFDFIELPQAGDIREDKGNPDKLALLVENGGRLGQEEMLLSIRNIWMAES